MTKKEQRKAARISASRRLDRDLMLEAFPGSPEPVHRRCGDGICGYVVTISSEHIDVETAEISMLRGYFKLEIIPDNRPDLYRQTLREVQIAKARYYRATGYTSEDK